MGDSNKTPQEKQKDNSFRESKARRDLRKATRTEQWTLENYKWTNQHDDKTLTSKDVPTIKLTVLQPTPSVDVLRILGAGVDALFDVVDVAGAATTLATDAAIAYHFENNKSFFQSNDDLHLEHLKNLYPGVVVGTYELPFISENRTVNVDNIDSWGDEMAGNARLLESIAGGLSGKFGKVAQFLTGGLTKTLGAKTGGRIPHKKTYQISDSADDDITFEFHLLNDTIDDVIKNTKLRNALMAECHHVRLAAGFVTQSPNIIAVDLPCMRIKRFATAMSVSVTDVGAYRKFQANASTNDKLNELNSELNYGGIKRPTQISETYEFPDAYRISITLRDIAGQKSLNGFYFGLGPENSAYPVGEEVRSAQKKLFDEAIDLVTIDKEKAKELITGKDGSSPKPDQ